MFAFSLEFTDLTLESADLFLKSASFLAISFSEALLAPVVLVATLVAPDTSPFPAFALLAKLGAMPVTTNIMLSIHTHALYAIPASPVFLLLELKLFISASLQFPLNLLAAI